MFVDCYLALPSRSAVTPLARHSRVPTWLLELASPDVSVSIRAEALLLLGALSTSAVASMTSAVESDGVPSDSRSTPST